MAHSGGRWRCHACSGRPAFPTRRKRHGARGGGGESWTNDLEEAPKAGKRGSLDGEDEGRGPWTSSTKAFSQVKICGCSRATASATEQVRVRAGPLTVRVCNIFRNRWMNSLILSASGFVYGIPFLFLWVSIGRSESQLAHCGVKKQIREY